MRPSDRQRVALPEPRVPLNQRPRVYGDEKRFKVALARYVTRGSELLDQAEGVRRMLAAIPRPAECHTPTLLAGALERKLVEEGWMRDVERWHLNLWRSVKRYLSDGGPTVLPITTAEWPSGRHRHDRGMERMEQWLRESVDELRALIGRLGVSRHVAAVAPESARFAELLASGLVDPEVIEGYARAMRTPTTPKQLADAIGAAKDLTEATLRAALAAIDAEPPRRDDLTKLMKDWRSHVARLATPDPAMTETLDRAQAALASVVHFIAEWRNEYGTGHGRPRYPPGLRKRHARLAVDSAETAIRFVVNTMDDLALLSV